MKNIAEKHEEFNDYPEALAALARRLRGREFDPDEYYIVLTPDRYTQTVENALFLGGGAIDTEVLTLSRLARRIAPNDNTLNKEGGVMLVARAVEKVKHELCYYGRASVYYDFARAMYDTLQQFRASGIDLSAVDTSGTSAVDAKLKDFKIIKREYEKLKAEYSDSSDRLIELAAAVECSDLIKKSHVYAIGYEFGYDTTALNRTVFDAIAENAKEFTEYKVAPEDKPRERIAVFAAPDRASQYKEIATRIKKYLYDGGDPDDVFIICTEPRALARILGEYGIEFYHDECVPLENTPPLALIDCIYRLKPSVEGGKALESKTLVALCKNPFSGVADADAQRLQLAVKSKRFVKTDERRKFDDGALRAIDRANTLVSFFSGSFADSVKNTVEKAEFEKSYAELYGNDTDGITPILGLAELVERYGSGEFDLDAKAFFSAAHVAEIKSLPRFRKRVTVTVPQTLRMTRCKKLLIADFNEGVLPTATPESGLMSDDELYYINSGVCKNRNVQPTVREQNRRERRELFTVVKNADDVFCSYITANRMKLSAFASEIAEFKDEFSYSEASNVLLNTDDPDYIAMYACTTAAAREIVARKASKHCVSVRKAVGDCDFRAASFVPVVPTEARKKVSVSELCDWFVCPYKRYLRDVIGVLERRSELDAVDFGIVVHEFMREFLSKEPYDLSEENIEKYVLAALEKSGLDPDERTYKRIMTDAREFAELNVHILEAGKYKPVGFEQKFENVRLNDGCGIEFIGVIDRLDKYGDSFRILDYKTGAVEFKINNCLLGTDMQLPLYAYAVGADKVTGYFYVKLGSKFDNKSKPLHGTFIRDTDCVAAYDDKLGNFEPSDILSAKFKLDKKSGEVAFDGRYKGGMTREKFIALIEYCVRNASLAVDEMAVGYIDRTPIDGACEYCAFRGICGDNVVSRTKDISSDFVTEADDNE